MFALLAFVPWTGTGGAAGSRLSHPVEITPSECATESQGPMLDDPNVDTDPDRPITENAAMLTDDGDDQSDDDADGMCRSETLELWYQADPSTFMQALAATSRANS
jgi:hypothetical protein